MNWGTQLFLSADKKEQYSVDLLERKMETILRKPGIKRLLFWNPVDDAYTGSVLKLCRENGVECWVWFPVLADPLVSSGGARPAMNYMGEHGMCSPGSMEPAGEGDEDFMFVCPSDTGFQLETERHLAGLLERYEFAGVFLDRIRFPSFANGFPMLFSCLCPDCCGRMGLDPDALKNIVRSLSGKEFLDIFCRRDTGDYSGGSASLLETLFHGRTKLISEKVAALNRVIRTRGRGMALDLFTPGLSRGVGQDYHALGPMADWVKPMTYAQAWGPAGIPLELDCLYRGIRATFPELEHHTVMEALEDMMGHELAPYWDDRAVSGFPCSLAYTEWRRACEDADGCRVFPGIEMVHSELYKTKVEEQRIVEVIEMFAGKTDIIACWNCLEIPEVYFELLGQG